MILIHDDLIIGGDDLKAMTKHSLMFLKGPAREILNSIETKYNTVSVLIR